MQRSQPEVLLDRQAVCEVVVRYATAADARDWNAYRSCFSDEVEMDFSSWNEGLVGVMRADDWVSGVRAGLSGFDSTQHISANHLVTLNRDSAACASYVRASHVLDGECFVLGGHYGNTLTRCDDGWKISRCALTVTWTQGRRQLFEQAAERWAHGAEQA